VDFEDAGMMVSKSKTSNAVTILHRHHIKDDPQRNASLQAARLNAEVAGLCYQVRKQAKLSQGELAKAQSGAAQEPYAENMSPPLATLAAADARLPIWHFASLISNLRSGIRDFKSCICHDLRYVVGESFWHWLCSERSARVRCRFDLPALDPSV